MPADVACTSSSCLSPSFAGFRRLSARLGRPFGSRDASRNGLGTLEEEEAHMAARVLHGVNLAGWLTLEPWVTPRLFADSGALDEDALIASIGTKRS